MKNGMIVSFVVTLIWFAPLMTIDKALAYESISAKEALERWLADETVVLLDVRTLEEIYWVGSPAQYNDAGKIVPISFVIPWQFELIGDDGTVTKVENKEFDKIVERNFPKLDQEIIIFCRSGGRSGDAANALEAIGYTKISEIDTTEGGVGGFQGGKDKDGYRGYPGRLDEQLQVSWMDSGLLVTQSIDPELILSIKKPKE